MEVRIVLYAYYISSGQLGVVVCNACCAYEPYTEVLVYRGERVELGGGDGVAVCGK